MSWPIRSRASESAVEFGQPAAAPARSPLAPELQTSPSMRPSLGTVAVLVFLQMLPATLIVPAIRPLFAGWHAGSEGAMHAFMGLNMLGAAIAAPLVSRLRVAARAPLAVVAVLAALDALGWWLCSSTLPTSVVLCARTLEGAAHVAATSLLMAEAARLGRARGVAHAMGLAGAAVLLAIAAGSALGGLLVRIGPLVPFRAAAALSVLVAIDAAVRHLRAPAPERERTAPEPGSPGSSALRVLAAPISAAFVARFTVGAVVVSFALFAHKVHRISDARVGFLFACMTVPFALLVYPASRLGDYVPRSALLGGSALLYAVALAALGFAPPGLLPLVMLLAGTTSAALFAVVLCYAATASEGGVPRRLAMAWVNAAGCLGMISGTAAAGLGSALLKDPADPARGHRAAFLIAAASLLTWLFAARRWLAARYRAESPSKLGASRSSALLGSGTQRTQ